MEFLFEAPLTNEAKGRQYMQNVVNISPLLMWLKQATVVRFGEGFSLYTDQNVYGENVRFCLMYVYHDGKANCVLEHVVAAKHAATTLQQFTALHTRLVALSLHGWQFGKQKTETMATLGMFHPQARSAPAVAFPLYVGTDSLQTLMNGKRSQKKVYRQHQQNIRQLIKALQALPVDPHTHRHQAGSFLQEVQRLQEDGSFVDDVSRETGMNSNTPVLHQTNLSLRERFRLAKRPDSNALSATNLDILKQPRSRGTEKDT